MSTTSLNPSLESRDQWLNFSGQYRQRALLAVFHYDVLQILEFSKISFEKSAGIRKDLHFNFA